MLPTADERQSYSPYLRYVLAVFLVLAALLLRLALERGFGLDLPEFILFYPAVMFAALRFGLGPGLLATALTDLLAAIWVFPPIGELKVTSFSDSISLALFFFMGVFMSVVAERYRRSLLKSSALEKAEALHLSEKKLALAIASMADAVFTVDMAGKLVEFNDAFVAFHRFKSRKEVPAALDGLRQSIEVMYPDGQIVPFSLRGVPRALSGETAASVHYTLRNKETGESWIGSYNFSPLRDQSGSITGAVVSIRDITERMKAESALRASELRYRTIFQTSLDAITITRLSDGMIVDANQTFLDITGYSLPEIVGKSTLELGLWANAEDRPTLTETLRQRGSYRDFHSMFKRKNGEVFAGVVSASVVHLESEPCFLAVIRDITEARAAEEQIRNLAFFDPLTGLANRRLVMERLEKSIAFSGRNYLMRALFCVDLDDFKTLNESLGSANGDVVLREVAQRLADCVRDTDTVGRLGGDEFVLLIEDLSGTPEEAASEAKAIAEKILARVSAPIPFEGRECVCTCSIGITVFGGTHEGGNEILQQADIALYQAKEAGRGTVRFFSPELQTIVNARAAMVEDLRQALKTDQLVLYYQPQIEGGSIVGAEALLRWNHPTLGLVPPDDFIPLAEETQLIFPLGDWVLETACRQIAAWAGRREGTGITVAVNISVLELRKQDFVERVFTALSRAGANPRNLKLELTESSLVDNVEDVIAKMTILKARGVRFSVDDFGTGYSSLAYLKRLPLHQLKIDLSFVRDLMLDSSSAVIAQTIISLGRTMGLSVIAEGVETEEQRGMLADLGCKSYQGFLFGRPLPLAEFETLLENFAGDAEMDSH